MKSLSEARAVLARLKKTKRKQKVYWCGFTSDKPHVDKLWSEEDIYYPQLFTSLAKAKLFYSDVRKIKITEIKPKRKPKDYIDASGRSYNKSFSGGSK